MKKTDIGKPAHQKLSIKIRGEKVTDLKAFLELKKLEREKTFSQKSRHIHENRTANKDNRGEKCTLPNQKLKRKDRGNGDKGSAV